MDIDNLFDSFHLTKNECEILLAIQNEIIKHNIENTKEDQSELKLFKDAWYREWKKMIYSTFKGTKSFKVLLLSEIEIKLADIENPLKRKIILLEASIFTPYFNLNKRDLNIKKLKEEYSKEKEKRDVPSIVQNICSNCKIEKTEIKDGLNAYNDAIKGIPERNITGRIAIILGAAIALGVTGGWAAPAIGSFIGGILGLSGAAATSAGLALLGGGAIAAGGFGMAGGTALLIGGGSILGSLIGIGAVLSSNILENDDLILSQLAKIEAIVKVFLNNDFDTTTKFIKNHREVAKTINAQLEGISKHMDDLDPKDVEETKKREKGLKKSLEYCERSIERLKDFI